MKKECCRWEKQMCCHLPAPACTFFQVTPWPCRSVSTEWPQSEQTFPSQRWMIRRTAQITQIKFQLWQPQQEIALGYAAPGVVLGQTVTQCPLGTELEEGGRICASPILFLSFTLSPPLSMKPSYIGSLHHTASFDHYCKELKEHAVLV